VIQQQTVLSTYAPALIFIAVGASIGIVFGLLNKFLGPSPRANNHKSDPYESGMPSEIKQGFRFGISFYMIAILFLLFDIEVLFLYPIAVELRAFGTFALLETITFIGLLFVGFGYVWRRGALTWK
jgi:NADH-quinone oxidoreductase subunit A